MINHLRILLTRAHKKSYTISVGKLNPAKLANFVEIECFVLVACPENSLIDTKVRYPCPTPPCSLGFNQPFPPLTRTFCVRSSRRTS